MTLFKNKMMRAFPSKCRDFKAQSLEVIQNNNEMITEKNNTYTIMF